jgi:hypothetical protein
MTRSRGNVLFEFDGGPALDLYERYLGEEEARGLPGSGLLFPLRIFDPERPDHDIVRTILAVDHQARSMTFAGDVPEGWTAQLMRGNFDRLAAGAAMAARQAAAQCRGENGSGENRSGDQVAILVSCIGRRLLWASTPPTSSRPRAPSSDRGFRNLDSTPTGKFPRIACPVSVSSTIRQ